MNIVQLHERVRFWVDVVASTRFESQEIDNALNASIDSKVRESYDQNRPMNRSDAFQRVQRVRDELGPLVTKATDNNGIDVTNNSDGMSISLDNTERYGYLLAIRMNVSSDPTQVGSYYPCYPLSFDRKNIVSKNPFRRVRLTPEPKVYYYEEDGDIKVLHPFGTSYAVYGAEVYYLKTPAIVNYGVEYDNTHSFTYGDEVIAVVETFYNGVTYTIGEKFTIVAPYPNITSGGLVVFGYTECDVRSTTHEEISRRAAINCLLTAGQSDKAAALRQEIMAS